MGTEKQKMTYSRDQEILQHCSQIFVSNFPFDNDFWKSLRCLQPKRRLEPSSCILNRKIAKDMPMIDSDNIALVTDELKLYQTEPIDENLLKTEDEAGEVKFRKTDHYWRDILSIKMQVAL